MATLNARLDDYFARDWRQDLTPLWRELFEGVGPNMDELPDGDVPEVFPPRLALRRAREPEYVPAECHMLRAFDGLTPDRVRVVIIGQDPYPRPDRATGRAFEDGAWDGNNPATAAVSLRRLLQSAAAHEHPGLGISEEQDDWERVCEEIREETIAPPAAPAFFDALAAQGVLCVNAAWTFTDRTKAEKAAHLRVWKPVMTHLLRRLTWRDGLPVVFLLLGDDARTLFRSALGATSDEMQLTEQLAWPQFTAIIPPIKGVDPISSAEIP